MKIAIKNDTVFIKDADPNQCAAIQSWNAMTWDGQTFRGDASAELLDRLAAFGRLPAAAEAYRYRLRLQDVVDRERVRPSPAPRYPYPVKIPLYAHQIRAANMCLLLFDWTSCRGDER